MTLTEFLLARIAEDEAAARDVVPSEWGFDVTADRRFEAYNDHVEVGVARVLAECEAKRRRVELFAKWDALCSPDDWPEGDMSGAALADSGRHLLRIEALPYADHPDYDEAWRVS